MITQAILNTSDFWEACQGSQVPHRKGCRPISWRPTPPQIF